MVRTILWSLLSYKRFWRNTMCFSSQREGFISSSSLNRSLNNIYCSLMASTTKNGQNLNSKFTGATLLVVQRNFTYWQCSMDFAWFCQIHSSPVGLLFTFWLLIQFLYHSITSHSPWLLLNSLSWALHLCRLVHLISFPNHILRYSCMTDYLFTKYFHNSLWLFFFDIL